MPLNADCLAHLGLSRPPFEPNPGVDFIYADPLLDGLLELAQRALTQPEAIVILAGAPGSGRSTQLMRLLGMLPETLRLIAFRARPQTSFDAIELTIRHHLQGPGDPDLTQPLSRLLATELRVGAGVLIAIDDAQCLGTEDLETLMTLRKRLIEALGRAPRLVLVGDIGFGQANLPGLDGVDNARLPRLRMRGFNREQTLAYLRFRLQTAGHANADSLLRDTDLDALHMRSNGLPEQINVGINEWLESHCRARMTGISALSAAAPAAPPPLTSPLTAMEALSRATTRNPSQPMPSATATPTPAGRAPAIWNHRGFIPAVVGLVAASILIPLIWQLPGSNSASSVPERSMQPLPPALPQITVVTPQSQVADQAPPVNPMPTTPAPDSVAIPASQAPLPVTPTPAPPPALSDPSRDAWPEASAAPAPEPAEIAVAVSSQDAPAVTAAPIAERPTLTNQLTDISWLLAQDAAAFTIQLTAAESLNAARAHVAQFGISDARFIPIQAKRREYIVALIGSYPDALSAQRAADRLPAALRGQGYWVRTIGSVRESLR